MSIEIKTLLNPIFLETETGRNLLPLQSLVLGRYSDIFPISPKKAARILAFEDENTGESNIKRWVACGMIILDDRIKHYIRAEELLLLQVTKTVLYTLQNYSDSLIRLHQIMAGSGLENRIGDKLNPDFKMPPNTRFSLVARDDPWYFDEVMITPERRIK